MNVLEHLGPIFTTGFFGVGKGTVVGWVYGTLGGSSQHLKRVFLITMISKCPKWGWFPFKMTFFMARIHEGDPNYLH